MPDSRPSSKARRACARRHARRSMRRWRASRNPRRCSSSSQACSSARTTRRVPCRRTRMSCASTHAMVRRCPSCCSCASASATGTISKTLRTQFQDGVAAGTPLLSPFVLLSQPSSRHEQLRCATGWTAVLAPAADVSAVARVARRSSAHRLSVGRPLHACDRISCGRSVRGARSVALRDRRVFDGPGRSQCDARSSRARVRPVRRCRRMACAAARAMRFATMASTSSSISRATRRARRRPCSRCARHRSRSTTSATREHSAAISSTT